MKISLDHFGNLQVTSKIGTKRCLEQPKLVGLFWQPCGHQQNWYEKTLGAAKIRISYFGNLMVTITTDTKINLEHSKFLWIILAIFRSPAKLVREKLLAQPQFLWIILAIFRSPAKLVREKL